MRWNAWRVKRKAVGGSDVRWKRPETYRLSFLFVSSGEEETLSSVMRISKGPAVTGKPGDCGYDSKCKRTAEKVAVRRRYEGTAARTGEY